MTDVTVTISEESIASRDDAPKVQYATFPPGAKTFEEWLDKLRELKVAIEHGPQPPAGPLDDPFNSLVEVVDGAVNITIGYKARRVQAVFTFYPKIADPVIEPIVDGDIRRAFDRARERCRTIHKAIVRETECPRTDEKRWCPVDVVKQ
jgi:hypothetical protein